MSDGGICEQAFDVGLRDGDYVADDHRRGGEYPQHVGHVGGDGGECGGEHAEQCGKARDLRARGHERGHRSGRALVHVGSPHVEGDGGDLEAESDEEEGGADG